VTGGSAAKSHPRALGYDGAVSAHREVELKLEASPEDLRRLQRHPLVQTLALGRGIARNLVSVYFDTPDADLAAAGFGLRVRSQGAERIQTVKGDRSSAGGLFERSEVECPLEGEEPDLERLPDAGLREQLREIIGDKPLRPVFRTEFRRTRRTLRNAESEWTLDIDEGEIVADDEREPIHELELELRAGEASRMMEFALMLQEQFDLLPGTRSKAERGYALALGTPPPVHAGRRVALDRDATVEVALEAILGQCLAQLTANAECACEGSDPEGVHQMRVGMRRARAALAVFQSLLPQETTRLFRSDLQWLGRELGGARDLDVLTRELLSPIEPFLAGDPAFKRLCEEAIALRVECYAEVREVLHSPRYARFVLELGTWISGRAWRNQALSESSARLFAPARDFARELLDRRHRKVRRLGERIGESDEARHALRIQLKKLRYGGEFFRDLFPNRHAKRYLRRIAGAQGSLGRMNDVATAHRILETLLARLGEERAPAHDRAAGFVEGWTAQIARAELDAVAAAWDRLSNARPFWRD